jgi:hypothetical protein
MAVHRTSPGLLPSLLPVHHRQSGRSRANSSSAWQPVHADTWDWKLEKAKAMLRFMAPALVLPLSDPLMSLIDAVCLGHVCNFYHPDERVVLSSVALLNIEPLGAIIWSEFGGRNTWKSQSDLGRFPHK